mmetsp:Transcript_3847/g.6819  ORF Transcript_3847/g.6819 Transcript_3847/m.6819 type:complete len:235 (-) Transcript_3847:14-718(-)
MPLLSLRVRACFCSVPLHVRRLERRSCRGECTRRKDELAVVVGDRDMHDFPPPREELCSSRACRVRRHAGDHDRVIRDSRLEVCDPACEVLQLRPLPEHEPSEESGDDHLGHAVRRRQVGRVGERVHSVDRKRRRYVRGIEESPVHPVALKVEYQAAESDESRREEKRGPPVHKVHVQRHATAEWVERLEGSCERVQVAMAVFWQEVLRMPLGLLEVRLRVHGAHVLFHQDVVL